MTTLDTDRQPGELGHTTDHDILHIAHSRSLIVLGREGILIAPDIGALRIRWPFPITIVGITMACGTAPTGNSIKCDFNKNGTTIYTTQANRPTIAAGANATVSPPLPDITAFAAGDYLTMDVDQVGSTAAGADLTAMIQYEAA